MVSSRALARPLTLLASVLAAAAALSLSAPPAQAAGPASAIQPRSGTDVTGDDGGDLYRGTGGLVVPDAHWRSDGPTRSDVAGCLDCEWRITRLCSKQEAASGGCRRIDVGCPVGTIAVRVWLRHLGGEWVVVGETCQGDGPPRTVTEVGGEVRAEVEQLLPPLRVRVQPEAAALVHVPVVGRTGQPAAGLRDADLSVLGVQVILDARVRWRWDWSDGDAEWLADPGGRWPVTTVSHAYASAGRRTISVTAVWRGQFSVEGLGPFDVPGDPLTQDDRVTIDVREAHAVLTR